MILICRLLIQIYQTLEFYPALTKRMRPGKFTLIISFDNQYPSPVLGFLTFYSTPPHKSSKPGSSSASKSSKTSQLGLRSKPLKRPAKGKGRDIYDTPIDLGNESGDDNVSIFNSTSHNLTNGAPCRKSLAMRSSISQR